ncbi:hypothetical protein LC593_30885 [Nostoc sp. CHAB 5844]|nr:hypothetical protein [Nostoc sp. CHAB 5844]
MKSNDRPAPEGSRVKLSGVVTAPHPEHFALEAWKELLIASFVETRFQNVLARARVLQPIKWFWHSLSNTHISDKAVAIIADNTNDYRQILIKHNQLTNTVKDLHPEAEVLLLVSPEQDFVFGAILETGEIFSTHILFTEYSGRSNQELRRKHDRYVAKLNSSIYSNSVGGCIS